MSLVAYEVKQERQEQGGGEEALVSMVRHSETPVNQSDETGKAVGAWIGAGLVAGLVCGLMAATLVHSERHASVPKAEILEPAAVTQTIVPVTYSEAAVGKSSKHGTEIETIRARNRRLEALVKVLRRRDADERGVRTVSRAN